MLLITRHHVYRYGRLYSNDAGDRTEGSAGDQTLNAALERWAKHFNTQMLNFYGDGCLCIFPSALVERVPTHSF